MKQVLVYGKTTDGVLKKLAAEEQHVQVKRLKAQPDDKAAALSWLQKHGTLIEYVLTNGHDGFPNDYLDHVPNLKLISSNGVGYDAIDTDEAVRQNILVTHTPNVLNAETSTTALLLYLACYRDFVHCEAYARNGNWATDGPYKLTRTADGRKVGILGMGRIGLAIAKKLEAFGCSIVYHTRTPKEDVSYRHYSDLVAMAKDVECLVCIVPGGPATKHMVNETVLTALGSDGVLINVSRGSVVDEQALIEALVNGHLGWAGLDVFENEPTIPANLRALRNVVLLPHVGSATVETRAAMGDLTVDNILRHIQDGTVVSPVPECGHLCIGGSG